MKTYSLMPDRAAQYRSTEEFDVLCKTCGIGIVIPDKDKGPDGQPRWKVEYCLKCALWGEPYERIVARMGQPAGGVAAATAMPPLSTACWQLVASSASRRISPISQACCACIASRMSRQSRSRVTSRWVSCMASRRRDIQPDSMVSVWETRAR